MKLTPATGMMGPALSAFDRIKGPCTLEDVIAALPGELNVREVLDRLERDGFIRKRVALIDRRKVGLNAHVFAQVKLDAHGRANLDEFSAAIRGFPEVLDAYVLMGTTDFMLRIVARDIDAYERFFFDQLSKLPGVQEINSTVALSEIKATTELPLGQE